MNETIASLILQARHDPTVYPILADAFEEAGNMHQAAIFRRKVVIMKEEQLKGAVKFLHKDRINELAFTATDEQFVKEIKRVDQDFLYMPILLECLQEVVQDDVKQAALIYIRTGNKKRFSSNTRMLSYRHKEHVNPKDWSKQILTKASRYNNICVLLGLHKEAREFRDLMRKCINQGAK